MSYQYYLHLIANGLFNPLYDRVPFVQRSQIIPTIRPSAITIQSNPPYKPEPNIGVEEEEENDEDERSLYIANLDERVTEELFYEVFLQAGPIERAHIPKDTSGRPRSFGFITYKHRSSAPYAMRLYHGIKLFRKALYIKFQGKSKI